MLTRSLDSYVKLGTGIRYLIDLEPGTEIHGEGLVIENLDGLLSGLERLGFIVSARGAQPVRVLRERLAKQPTDAVLSVADREEIFNVVNEIYPIVRAEAGGMITFVVTDKRFDINKLLGGARALLAPGIYDVLPEIARHDLDEAAKCVAFERPTAAAFHMLRATEAVLRWMYLATAPDTPLEPMLWHPVIEALRNHSSNPPRELLDHLDNIRRSFRNPTQHPEKTYDIYEAQDLLALCADAITRMGRHVSGAGTAT